MRIVELPIKAEFFSENSDIKVQFSRASFFLLCILEIFDKLRNFLLPRTPHSSFPLS